MSSNETVLVVTADLTKRTDFYRELREASIEVIAAASLAEARGILFSDTRARVAAVVVDDRLPDGRGADLLRHEATHLPPILVVSDDTDPSWGIASARAMSLGAAGYLFTPLERGELVDRLRRVTQE